MLRVQQCQEVGAVVHGHLGLGFQSRFQVLIVGRVVLALDGICRDTVLLDQCRGDIVLGAEGVAGAEDYLGAAVTQCDGQVGRFAGHVQARGKAHASQGLFLYEALLDDFHHGHFPSGPFDLVDSVFRQGQVFHVPFGLL